MTGDYLNLKVNKLRKIGHQSCGWIDLIFLPGDSNSAAEFSQSIANNNIEVGYRSNYHGSPGNWTTTGILNLITHPISSLSTCVLDELAELLRLVDEERLSLLD